MGVKIVSINIERQKHLESVKSFLETEKPDVVCMQELHKSDVMMFAELLDMMYVFEPMFNNIDENFVMGTAIFAKHLDEISQHWIGGSTDELPLSRNNLSSSENYNLSRYLLITAKAIIEGDCFVIGTVHLPVTEKGEVTDFQLKTMQQLLSVTKEYDELLFCGDFNAPRGREVFDTIANHYTDNIPIVYETSLDKDIHRAGYIPFMVDGLFSTPQYMVSNVRLVNGVSDHLAVVGEVMK